MVHVGKPGLWFYQALVNPYVTYANMQLMAWLMQTFFSMESSEMSQGNIIKLMTKEMSFSPEQVI